MDTLCHYYAMSKHASGWQAPVANERVGLVVTWVSDVVVATIDMKHSQVKSTYFHCSHSADVI
jgi:hypothetical protein